MTDLTPGIRKVLDVHEYSKVTFPTLNQVMYYKFIQKSDHTILNLIALDTENGTTERINLSAIAKQLYHFLDNTPFQLRQAIPLRELKIKSVNLYKGLNRFGFFNRQRIRLFYYDDKLLIISFLPVIITIEGDEIRSKFHKKEPPIRVDHVPVSKFHDYLTRIRVFQDEQLKNIPFINEQDLVQKNDRVFVGFIGFMTLISVISLIEAFLRIAPLLGFPITLIYIAIALGIAQLAAYRMMATIRSYQQFSTKCPLLTNPGFPTVDDKILEPNEGLNNLLDELKELETTIPEEEVATSDMEDMIMEINELVSTESESSEDQIMVQTSFPALEKFRKIIDTLTNKWKGRAIDTPEFRADMEELVLTLICHRYVMVKGGITSGMRSILSEESNNAKKINKIIAFYKQYVSNPVDQTFEKVVQGIEGMVIRLHGKPSDSELRSITKFVENLVQMLLPVHEDVVQQVLPLEPMLMPQMTIPMASSEPLIQKKEHSVLDEMISVASIPSIMHDKNEPTQLLAFGAESSTTKTKIIPITLKDFEAYWSHPKSFLVIHDNASKNSVNEFHNLVERAKLDAFSYFSLDLGPAWSSVKRPVILYKNDEKKAFVVEEFDPSTFRDMIDDAPSLGTQISFESFSELKDIIRKQVGTLIVSSIPTEEVEDTDKLKEVISSEKPVIEIEMSELEKLVSSSFEEISDDLEAFADDRLKYKEDEREKLLIQSGKAIQTTERYQDWLLGHNPEVDFARITTKEEFMKIASSPKYSYVILHDNDFEPEKAFLPPFPIDFRIRSISLKDYEENERLRDALESKWLVKNPAEFKRNQIYRTFANKCEMKTMSQYISDLNNSKRRVEGKNAKIAREILGKNGFVGIIAGRFDSVRGHEKTHEIGKLNGDINVRELLQNIMDDKHVKQTSIRQINDFNIYIILQREEGLTHDRGLLLEAYIALFKQDVTMANLERMGKHLQAARILAKESVAEKCKEYYRQVKSFMLDLPD